MEERDFIDFQFDGKWASEMNLKAVSSGDRYSPPMFGSVNPNIATMVGKEGIYKWNTQIGEKIFNISVAYDNITMEDLRKIAEWLNPFTIGKLVFKEQPYKYYWASLNSEPQISYVPFKTEEKEINGVKFKQGIFKGELSLSFVCISNYGYSDWSSFEEEFEYQKTLLENQSDFYLENSSDKKMSITNIQGAQEQKIIQAEEGKTAEGKGNIYLSDVDNTKESVVNIGGGERQATREGTNILDLNVQQNKKVTVNEDGTITINGNGGFFLNFKKITLQQGITYYQKYELISGNITGSQVFMSFNEKNWLNSNAFTSYTPTENIDRQKFWIHVNAIFENAVIKIWTNTDQSDFEAYGASPSPDYPSEVEVVEGTLEITKENEDKTLSEVYNLPIQQPMLSGDTFVKEDGNWFEVHGWDKRVFSGEENWKVSSLAVEGYGSFYIDGLNLIQDTLSFCNYFKRKLYQDWSSLLKDNFFHITNISIGIRISNSIVSNLEEFKQWLVTKNNEGNPLYIWYQVTTPTKLPCTPEQVEVLEQLNNNPLYNGINNIFTSNELATINTHYNFVTYSPSPNKPSEVRAVGDNINLFDEWEKGTINNKGAKEDSDVAIRTINFINVKPNSKITYKIYDKSINNIALFEYDQNENFIKVTYNLTINKTITISSTTQKIKMRIVSTNLGTKMKIEEGPLTTSYSPYGMGSVEINKTSKNLFDESTQSKGQVLYTSGGITVEVSSWLTSDYIEIDNINDSLELLGNTIATRILWCEYDNQKKYIGERYEVSFGNDIALKNINTKYIRFSINDVNATQIALTKESEVYNLPIQQPILSGDTFVKEADGWKEVHDWKKVALTGSENIVYYNAPDTDRANAASTAYFTIDLSSFGENYDNKKGNVFCNYFNNLFDAGGLWASANSEALNKEAVALQGTLRLRIYKTRLTNYSNDMTSTEKVNLLKQYLTERYNEGNPVYIWYKLYTPKKLPCTPEQANILNKLNENSSYFGTTYINLTSSVSPKATVSYIQEQPIYIDFVPQGSNLLNYSSFYESNNIYTKEFFDIESGDPSTSGISNDRPIYLQNAGNYNANLNLTFDLIRINEDEPLVISIYKTSFDNNGNFINLEEEPYSQITLESYLKYKPFADIYDDNINNWQIQIDSELNEVYIKHKTDKEKIVSINKFNKNQTFLHLADCKNVDYLKLFPTSKSEIKDSAIKDIVLNKIIVESSTTNYRLKNVKLDWKHTYI